MPMFKEKLMVIEARQFDGTIAAIHAIYMVTEPQAALWIDLNKYLKALLEIQRLRAVRVVVDNNHSQKFTGAHCNYN